MVDFDVMLRFPFKDEVFFPPLLWEYKNGSQIQPALKTASSEEIFLIQSHTCFHGLMVACAW